MAIPSTPGTTPARPAPAAAATDAEPHRRLEPKHRRASAPSARFARRFPFGLAARTRELVLLVVGVTTPIGILAVNAAAFVMGHLDAFRLVIAACALISSVLLNGLTALWVLRAVAARATSLYTEYRNWLIGAAGVLVIASSAFAAYFTYVGMQDPKHLPNQIAVITAVLALGIPFALTWIGRRMSERKA